MRPGRRGSKHKVIRYLTGSGLTRKYPEWLAPSLGTAQGLEESVGEKEAG